MSRWRRRRAAPALPVQDSVTKNFIICLETGTRHVTLSRHIKENLNLTPEQYRRRWGLPDDYPMVADVYAARRQATRSGQA